MNEYEQNINSAIALLEKVAPILDEDQSKYFTDTLEALANAKEMLNEDEEKTARMQDAAVKFANQACFIAFRDNALTDELTAEYRALPTPEKTSEIVKNFNDKRQERIDELNKQHEAIVEEQKELDLFLGVISGMTREEAARRMAEHDAQVQAQMQH